MRLTVEQAAQLRGEDRYQAYGALDAAGTLEIYQTLRSRLNEVSEQQYRWTLAQRSPAVCMTIRGVKVNKEKRAIAVAELGALLAVAEKDVAEDPLVSEVWDGTEMETGFCSVLREAEYFKAGPKKGLIKKAAGQQRHKWLKAETEEARTCERCGCGRMKPSAFNPSSPDQVKRLLYVLLKAPIQRNKKGDITTDWDALEAIGRKKPKLNNLCQKLLVIRDLDKQLGSLQAQLSQFDRFHSSFNVGGAWTGRWSSSQDPFRRGGNLQNITEQHRFVFEADRGMTMFYADLKTAESLIVAYMSGDENYIEAHKSDVHTYVCRLVWPEMPWTGDIKQDKKIATSTYPEWDNVPGHDFRFQSKGVQHGSNYGLSPFGMAIMRHIPVKAAKHAQQQFFKAFPGIPEWQQWTKARVQAGLPIRNPLGREVRLFGRPDDGATHKQAYAFGPQSAVGDILNLGLYRAWDMGDPHEIQLLAQIHDAILGQFPDGSTTALPLLKEAMEIPVEITDFRGVTRTCTIPVEVAIGKNWGKRNTDPKKGRLNEDGLEEVPL